MPDFQKGHWPKVAVGGLVLVNVVLLILLAVDGRSHSLTAEAVPAGQPAATQPIPTETVSPATSTPSSVSPQPTTAGTASRLPSSTVSPKTRQAPARRMLAVNSATQAWRALVGRCPTDPQVEVTQDGGRTWQPTDSGLQSISRMRSYQDAAVFAVGGDQECKPRYAAADGPEESWVANQRFLGQTWYRLPREQDRIHAPGGRLSSPCDDRLGDFAGVGLRGAAALCTDGKLRLTQDGGRRWREVTELATGRAVGADEQVFVLALRTADCAGVGVVLLTPGAREIDSDKVRCAPLGGGPDKGLAVAVRGQLLWLWAGDEVVVSTDRGRNWKPA
jgi:hypothetical protein